MLFTRCPSCDTTFRVTDEALVKASGQVRCGHCASVFNAYTELRETSPPDDVVTASVATPVPAAHQRDAPGAPASGEEEAYDDLSVAAVIAQLQLGGAEPQPEQYETQDRPFSEPRDANSLNAEYVQAVLADDPAALGTTAIWALENPPQPSQASGWWSVAALLAVLTLGLQGIHHFRAELASQALVGPWLRHVYGMLGAPVSPRWDVGQYQILDWAATAEPNTGDQGRLQVTARIRNRGPRAQPYPHIHLQLKDRWDETVGSRIFRPAQYLDSTATVNALMSPGDTARAQLEIVDPGPDAYGFELDVCVEAEPGVLTCGSDAVFL